MTRRHEAPAPTQRMLEAVLESVQRHASVIMVLVLAGACGEPAPVLPPSDAGRQDSGTRSRDAATTADAAPTDAETIRDANRGDGADATAPDCSGALTPPGLTPLLYDYRDPRIGGPPPLSPSPVGYGFGSEFGQTPYEMMINLDPSQHYIAMRVHVPTADHVDGGNFRTKFVYADAPGYADLGDGVTFSMSQCPGDFNPDTANCVGEFFGRTAIFTTNPDTAFRDTPSACIVEPGASYYFNIIFATPYDNDGVPYSVEDQCNITRSDITKCALFFRPTAMDDV
jgi:hypothetical protein